MDNYQLIKSKPSEVNFDSFQHFPQSIYDASSMRFKLGHDPVLTHLEGCYLLLKDNQPVGRFAFYENPDLKYKGEKTACIGSYECVDNEEISEKLINYAKEIAVSKDYKWLIGPMEGSTWNNYRFSKNNDALNFFMEPYHHSYYNQQFIANGFEEIASYTSNLDTSLVYDEEKLNKYEKHYIEKGASFRNLSIANLNDELNKIGELSLKGFSNNFLYTPIALADFVAKYEKLEQYFNSDLVWMVENEKGELQAFVFAIKNYLDPTNESIIVKSLVRDKDSSFNGIGSYLVAKIVQIAKEKGFKKIIHAFMFSDNASVNISEKYDAEVYKTYALYAKPL